MTQDKHTPGPWRISDSPKHPDSGGYAEILAGDVGIYIADIIPVQAPRQYGPDVADVDFDLDDETSMANAELIASAPTLQSRIDRLKDELKANIIVMDVASTKIDRLEAEKAELVEALRIVGKAGSDIADMANEFIITKDYQSLQNYGANIHTIARTALTDVSKHTPVSE